MRLRYAWHVRMEQSGKLRYAWHVRMEQSGKLRMEQSGKLHNMWRMQIRMGYATGEMIAADVWRQPA
jgi:hypothetical protein